MPQIEGRSSPGRHAIAYRGNNRTIRTDTHRLIVHGQSEFNELYDHRSDTGETTNIATSHPDLVTQLTDELNQRLAPYVDSPAN